MSYVKINDVVIGSNDRILFRGMTESSSTKHRETEYSGYDGADYDDITLTPRTVTVNGTLYGNSYENIESLKKILNDACNPKKEAEVRYFNGNTEYFAMAYPSLPVYSKINNFTYRFVVYLDISKFYWLSSEEIVQGVYRLSDNIFGDFTLPRPVSVMEKGAEAYNRGSVEVPIKLEVVVSESFTDTVTIENVTYNKKIILENYSFEKDEVITFATDLQTAESSLKGNIISYISEESELFILPLGFNRIECSRDGLTVVVKYRERFMGV